METLNQKLKRLVKESEKELQAIGLGDKLKSDIEYTCKHFLCNTCLSREILLSKFSKVILFLTSYVTF